MPLKLTCPTCGNPTRVSEPYPLPGAEVQCTGCGLPMSVSYPEGVMDKLKARGKRFVDEAALRPLPVSSVPRPQAPPPAHDPPSAPPTRTTELDDGPASRSMPAVPDRASEAFGEQPTRPRQVDPERSLRGAPERFPTARMSVDEARAMAASMDTPAEPPARKPVSHPTARMEIRKPSDPAAKPAPRRPPPPASVPAFSAATPPAAQPRPPAPPQSAIPTQPEATASAAETMPLPVGAAPLAPADPAAAARPERRATKSKADKAARKADKKAARPKGSPLWRWTKRLGCATVVLLVLLGIGGGAGVAGVYGYYGQQLPSTDALQTYEPPTVTEVYDNKETLMGELYEQRRYVVPLETIPDTVRNAFIAAEDSAFYDHGGVDYVGLVRAVINEATGGAKRQGASTITMQVTRNFLLTRDKTYERKIKEIILAQRIESVYDKERILWLYLNELYLGSGAYGVEAASRVYFGKHVDELTIAEAALIAGLAPAPSAYSPHKGWDKARTRQLYVLEQMLDNGFITQAEHDAAKDEYIKIVKEENPFLLTAPHFTEFVRRYIVDKYTHERVYNEGLTVRTTMDLELQLVAQKAVVDQVHRVDQRMGFRRAGLETLGTDEAIAARRKEQEKALRAHNAFVADPAGRVPEPAKSELTVGEVYDAVVLEAQKSWLRIGIGDHEAIVPIAWARWVYEPNPRMSWRRRVARDFTAAVRGWEEGVDKGGTLVRKGDVIVVKVEQLSTAKPVVVEGGDDLKAIAKALKGTPAESKDTVAARMWQRPIVEAATMSVDLETGAVRAMVGGADFETSEFNRATQAKRQVGSTFKPIVYAAAIDTERVTAASIVPDVRGASYTTDAGFVWKPDNYGSEYLGNITLRKALALSKNTCTVKVLESMDPGMNDDALYTFARKLGIGGPPSHTLPEDYVTKPSNDHLCPWVRETPKSTICMDRYPPKDPDLTNTAHRAQMGPDDEYMCRACDMSMGLGSASLTMEELLRAYSVFGTGGKLVTPHYILEVTDRDGNVLEKHESVEHPQVIRPEVATIGNWLLQNVVNVGTGAPARRQLGMRFGGKTGTTDNYKDTWFIGFSNDVMTAAWVGFDDPETLGVSSTGGRTALPIWIDVMRKAAPKETDRPFPIWGDIEWAQIDEETGARVTSGGRSYPFIRGTAPASTGVAAGQYTVDDFTEL